MKVSAKAKVRCAIYTRKSTEEGLDQEFNTLDAQREAGEAYVRSQAGEGWRVLSDHYDDGGFSGGNLERPAMKRLLADVDAGKVDVIIVYKVDRLTRSLMDFARIVERFDARGVSFVSVTQAFNTTTSMGRLTLNVLLSFAQFEREVTGERIRDKIAASKAKGMWMGGNIPLGYNLGDRKLIVSPAEAEQVQHIFERYLALGSGVDLMMELARDCILSKRWTSRAGNERGGGAFSCGALYYILQNRLYLGEILHRSVRHVGQHEAIVGEELFARVEERLASNRVDKSTRPTRAASCQLVGRVFDAAGELMSPSFSYGRNGRLYRYYVAASTLPRNGGRTNRPDVVQRVPAGPLEKLILQSLRSLTGQQQASLVQFDVALLAIEIHPQSIQLVVSDGLLREPHEPSAQLVERLGERVKPARVVPDESIEGRVRIILDRQPTFRGGKASRCEAENEGGDNFSLNCRLRAAHVLLQNHSMSAIDPSCHCEARAPANQRDRHAMVLGLLAPDLQRQILDGRTSELPYMRKAAEMPLDWAKQRKLSKRFR